MTIPTAAGNAAYMSLVARFPLRPIRTDADLERAGAIIDELIVRDDLDPGEEDYLDVLSDLVERYETEAHPMPPATDAGIVRYIMDARGLSQSQFAREIGAHPSTISEVLSGSRSLSKAKIRAIAARFHVSPAAFPLVSRPAPVNPPGRPPTSTSTPKPKPQSGPAKKTQARPAMKSGGSKGDGANP